MYEWVDKIEKYLPVVESPKVPLTLKQKLFYTAIVLFLFYIMGEIIVVGVDSSSSGMLEFYQLILASQIGSLISAGIGPIVLASIILQMLVGGGFININIHTPEGRRRFSVLQ